MAIPVPCWPLGAFEMQSGDGWWSPQGLLKKLRSGRLSHPDRQQENSFLLEALTLAQLSGRVISP